MEIDLSPFFTSAIRVDGLHEGTVLSDKESAPPVTATLQNFQHPISITMVYASCVRSHRRALWSNLASLSLVMQGPWSVSRDFNATIEVAERRSRRDAERASALEFVKAINNAGLIGVGFSGNRFTWSNNQGGSARVWTRLDRVVRIAWEKESSQHPLYNVLVKQKSVKQALNVWNKDSFGNIFEQLGQAERSPEEIESRMQTSNSNSGPDSMLQVELNSVPETLSRLELMEESFWRQKARSSWLEAGDRNTSFFYAVAMERHRKAEIRSIELNSGQIVEDLAELKRAVINHFEQQFTAI
ncbi:uncharacterized protein LOC131220117 [Magnolia sinica]|uniref:uncharacterized protein LOC131220117 n=1 Tax=Magnolia sinica TaxID=86752 RepID=UPI00265ADD87|nr:uncharacterized protein LOC131220117 [Magnolia sinica]